MSPNDSKHSIFDSELIVLFWSFAGNAWDYCKILIPLYIIFKVYWNNQKEFKNKFDAKRNFFFKFLDLYSFGSKSNNQTLLSINPNQPNNNQQQQQQQQQQNDTLNLNTILSFIVCFSGLQISFIVWGLMQERIIKYGYSGKTTSEKFSRFKNSEFLVLSNRLAGLFLSGFILVVFSRKSFKLTGSLQNIVSAKNWAPLFVCSYSSLSNVLSSWFQYEALKYVSFTTQLLAKSSKSVFVMLTGRVLFGKQYSLTEYVSVSIIAVGIFFFSDVNNIEGANKIIKTTLPGFICLLGYLVSDSFTSTWQDNLIKSFSMSSIALMFMTNLYSCLFTFVSLLSQGELNETIEFMKEHSDITYHLCYLSLASAIGQIFIFVTIQRFGALVFTLIMTTRQVLSILFSALIFQHQLSLQSVFGIFLIFSALFIQQFIKIANKYNFKKPLKSEKIII